MYVVNLDVFPPLFFRLLVEFSAEATNYRLDEIIVAAIASMVRRSVS